MDGRILLNENGLMFIALEEMIEVMICLGLC